MIVAFQGDSSVVVIKVALHNDEHDPYAEIARELNVSVSTAPRTKPPCCEDGVARTLDQEVIDRLEQSFRHLRGAENPLKF